MSPLSPHTNDPKAFVTFVAFVDLELYIGVGSTPMLRDIPHICGRKKLASRVNKALVVFLQNCMHRRGLVAFGRFPSGHCHNSRIAFDLIQMIQVMSMTF